MKAEIQQVLKMNREGTLTDEQAAELLTELARKEADAARAESRPEGNLRDDESDGAVMGPRGRMGRQEWGRGRGQWGDHAGLMDTIFSRVNDTVKHAMDGAFAWDGPPGAGPGATGPGGYHGEAYGSRTDRNSIHMSKFDLPEGKDHVFTGNAVRMSSVKDLVLDRAEMIDNTIDMSKVADLSVRDGKVIGCGIRASSVEDWSVDGATVRSVDIGGSKVSDFHCGSGSVVRGARVQGSSLKDFRIAENSKVSDLVLNGCAVSDANLIRTSLSAGEIHASQVAGLSVQDCQIKNLMLRMLCVKHSAFAGCTLSDVVISGREKWAWKRQGLRDVRLESCRMERVLFANCRLVDVTLRNLDLKDRQFRDLDLSGLVIDGNEAFLKAVDAAAGGT
jgi:uncharacterized protein YjbI with pentapeptide repeats